MNTPLARAFLIGLILAIVGVGLFLLLYFVILAGFDDAPRLFISMIAPPILMALLVGGYILLKQDEPPS